MTTEEPTEGGEEQHDGPAIPDEEEVRERIEEGADRAVEGFDRGLVDLLSWVLYTETKARIYVHLRQHPASTSEEIAEGTGLYPSTVREALAELYEEGTVERTKRESDGAGNDPYEYSAIAPSDLVTGAVDEVQDQLNTAFNLDEVLADEDDGGDESEPVTISVEETESTEAAETDETSTPDEDTEEAAAAEEGDEATEFESAETDESAEDDEDA